MVKAIYIRKLLNALGLIFIIFSVANSLLANGQEKQVVVENDGWKLVGDLLIPDSKKLVPAVILLNKANGNGPGH